MIHSYALNIYYSMIRMEMVSVGCENNNPDYSLAVNGIILFLAVRTMVNSIY